MSGPRRGPVGEGSGPDPSEVTMPVTMAAEQGMTAGSSTNTGQASAQPGPEGAGSVTMPVTMAAPTRLCAHCGKPYVPVGRRRHCTDACKAKAYRARKAAAAPPPPPLPRGRVRAASVYECPGCQARYVGEQRCPDCNLFCTRLGLGGECPHCAEPVAIGDLLDFAR